MDITDWMASGGDETSQVPAVAEGNGLKGTKHSLIMDRRTLLPGDRSMPLTPAPAPAAINDGDSMKLFADC